MPQVTTGTHWNKRVVMFLVGLVTLLALGVGFFVWYSSRPLEGAHLEANNAYQKQITALLKQPLPKAPIDQVYYYGQLGQNYDALERYDEALKYYKKGQAVVDANGLIAQAAFYEAMSKNYTKLGDKARADEYTKKAQERVRKYAGQAEDLPLRTQATQDGGQ